MNSILARQLSLDFCTDEKSVLSRENIFTEYKALEGRRIFQEGECFLKATSVNGKILATGKKEIIGRLSEKYKEGSGAWFMDMESIHDLEKLLADFECRVAQAHLFFIADQKTQADTKDYEIKIYEGGELEQFRGDARFSEAFIFDGVTKDEVGVAAIKDGVILGMAGATSDSGLMWQIGINVMPEAEGRGIGSMLVEVIKNIIIDKGRLPFYGTAMSHIASQRTALKAGFLPAWAELNCERIGGAGE